MSYRIQTPFTTSPEDLEALLTGIAEGYEEGEIEAGAFTITIPYPTGLPVELLERVKPFVRFTATVRTP